MKITQEKTECTMAVESITTCWEEALPMLHRHWREMPHEGDLPFDPDQAIYAMGEQMGVFRLFTVRADGRLVGYCCVSVHKSLWHKGTIEAGQHSLYVEPEYRKGRLGIRFIRFIEAALKAEGVRTLRQHSHLGRPESRLFRKLGYADVHIEHEKVL